MKKYRVADRKRFIIFIITILLAAYFITGFLFNVAEAFNKEKYDCVEVFVEYGDTLWNIAKEYGNTAKDVREVVYDICSINHISAESLRPGQVILVPVN